jgi:hypothetical protein
MGCSEVIGGWHHELWGGTFGVPSMQKRFMSSCIFLYIALNVLFPRFWDTLLSALLKQGIAASHFGLS